MSTTSTAMSGAVSTSSVPATAMSKARFDARRSRPWVSSSAVANCTPSSTCTGIRRRMRSQYCAAPKTRTPEKRQRASSSAVARS